MDKSKRDSAKQQAEEFLKGLSTEGSSLGFWEFIDETLYPQIKDIIQRLHEFKDPKSNLEQYVRLHIEAVNGLNALGSNIDPKTLEEYIDLKIADDTIKKLESQSEKILAEKIKIDLMYDNLYDFAETLELHLESDRSVPPQERARYIDDYSLELTSKASYIAETKGGTEFPILDGESSLISDALLIQGRGHLDSMDFKDRARVRNVALLYLIALKKRREVLLSGIEENQQQITDIQRKIPARALAKLDGFVSGTDPQYSPTQYHIKLSKKIRGDL